MARPACLPPAVRLGVCLPLFPPSSPPPPRLGFSPSPSLAARAGSPASNTSSPRHPSAFGPAHSRPSLSSPFCSAFQFILLFIARYCRDYCPGDRNGSSSERHTWWISLTSCPARLGWGRGADPGGQLGASLLPPLHLSARPLGSGASARLYPVLWWKGRAHSPFHRWGNRGLDCY